jgi:hypothetical protein
MVIEKVLVAIKGNQKRRGKKLEGGCGNWNPFSQHTSVLIETFLVAIIVWQPKIYQLP